jgi:hypothetical protein
MSVDPQPAAVESIAPRPPDTVMALARLGSFHQTRLSFLRAMLRRLADERWKIARPRFDFDAKGVGVGLYSVSRGRRTYSLVAFGHDLPAERRTDRVIAEAWDATFALYDGVPDGTEIERLRANVPHQEAGRYTASELVLARANRSVRLFDMVVDALARGLQPDRDQVEAVGYLMRTTAVYGNGKFGIADRDIYAGRPELRGPFRAEMLTVWLIRSFTVDLVEHLARLRATATAVAIEPSLRRRFGIGNATGLGMAPFLVKHPALIDRWISARETALARVRSVPAAGERERRAFRSALARARAALPRWITDDPVQSARIPVLARDLERLEDEAGAGAFDRPRPWDGLYRWAERELSLEGQELTVSLLLEPHGALIDDLADAMAIDEAAEFAIDGAMPVGALAKTIDRLYPWALAIDFQRAEATARFWYVSAEKLEPRLGERASEPGVDLEQPLAVARDVAALRKALAAAPAEQQLAGLLLRHPEHRHAVRRVEIAARHPYSEIRGNLIGATVRPIDMLRAKLSIFGCTRFDPRSDKWLRITLFQGAPYAEDLGRGADDGWIFGPDEASGAGEGAGRGAAAVPLVSISPLRQDWPGHRRPPRRSAGAEAAGMTGGLPRAETV